MDHERDPRLDRLATRLREDGVPPSRDLWPGIDAAITRREQAGRRRSRTVWWRAAAAAAAVLVLALGVRDFQHMAARGPVGGDSVQVAESAPQAHEEGDGMGAVAKALIELNAALAADPENHSLSRLVLMVHRTRGELLRRNPSLGLRAG